jgi:hypothetical protein
MGLILGVPAGFTFTTSDHLEHRSNQVAAAPTGSAVVLQAGSHRSAPCPSRPPTCPSWPLFALPAARPRLVLPRSRPRPSPAAPWTDHRDAAGLQRSAPSVAISRWEGPGRSSAGSIRWTPRQGRSAPLTAHCGGTVHDRLAEAALASVATVELPRAVTSTLPALLVQRRRGSGGAAQIDLATRSTAAQAEAPRCLAGQRSPATSGSLNSAPLPPGEEEGDRRKRAGRIVCRSSRLVPEMPTAPAPSPRSPRPERPWPLVSTPSRSRGEHSSPGSQTLPVTPPPCSLREVGPRWVPGLPPPVPARRAGATDGTSQRDRQPWWRLLRAAIWATQRRPSRLWPASQLRASPSPLREHRHLALPAGGGHGGPVLRSEEARS